MQFPKVSLVICALALGAAGSLCAADNPAQSAARTALAQKLFELSAQQPSATNPVETPKVAVAQPAPVAQPVPTSPVEKTGADAQPVKELKVNPAGDNPDQAAARAALAEKLFALSAQQQPVNNVPVAQPVKTCPMDKTKTSMPTEAKVKVCPAKQAPVCAQTEAELKAKQVAAKKTEKAAADVWYPGKDTGLPPIAAPASPLTPVQESKLQALLEKYKADQLTSEQYQLQRAAVLAAP